MTSKQNPTDMPSTDLSTFIAHLRTSKRIVAVLGAGLSASSGLPTFRGKGGFWRTHDATQLATPDAFEDDPGLVWQFYSYRPHMALNAKPNAAHYALAALAKQNPHFLTLSQNVDGLSPRAGHPAEQLKLLHGNLFDVKCWDEDRCGYVRQNDFTDPIVPALAIPEDPAAAEASIAKAKRLRENSVEVDGPVAKKAVKAQDDADEGSTNETTETAITAAQSPSNPQPSTTPPKQPTPQTPLHSNPLIHGLDISSVTQPLPSLPASSLPTCPKCTTSLLRPGVVWFGESLPEAVLSDVDAYFSSPEPIDLCLVIGTSSRVYPAAGYADLARHKGARVAVVNVDGGDARGLDGWDWLFVGDAAEILPRMVEGVVGKIPKEEEKNKEKEG